MLKQIQKRQCKKNKERRGGELTEDGTRYETLNEYTEGTGIETRDTPEIDWETIFEDAESHPDQTTEGVIGIGTDGKPVNMDLWTYSDYQNSGTGWTLSTKTITNNAYQSLYIDVPGYSNGNIINGEIQGKVPQYIKEDGEGAEFKPVLSMHHTFLNCMSLVVAPKIPSTVIDMTSCFEGCRNLVVAPQIPESVTQIASIFRVCTSLKVAPEIPQSVTNMSAAFFGCSNLKTAPEIPQGVTTIASAFQYCTSLKVAPSIPNTVTNMQNAFSECTELTTPPPEIPSSVTKILAAFADCNKLTGNLVINIDPSSQNLTYNQCLSGAATNEGTLLRLSGNAGVALLNAIKNTAGSESHVVVEGSEER